MKVTSEKDIIQAVADNHIWLNAMSCVSPSAQFCEDLGREILSMLRKDRLLPKFNGDISGESPELQTTMNEMAQLTPTLYLSINKS